MNGSMKILSITLILTALIISQGVLAQNETKKSDVILSFGQSEILRSNKAISRKEALKECLTDALRQFVAQNTSKRIFELNYGVLKNKIYDNYSIYLKNYRIKEEDSNEGFYKITAEVKLKTDLIAQKLKNLGLTVTSTKKPKLLFLISDSVSSVNEVNTQSWWLSEDGKTTLKDTPLSLKLENRLKAMDFELVKRASFISKMQSYQISLKKNILKGDIEAIKNMHLGDVLIIGTSRLDKKIKSKKSQTATAHLSVKVVNLNDTTSLSNIKKSFNVAWAVKKSRNMGEKITEHEAIRSFVDEFAGDLVESFLPKWQLSQADIKTVDIDLEGLYSYNDYQTVKEAIHKFNTIIPSILEYSMRKGLFRWKVELNGNPEQLFNMLELIKIKDKNLSVTADSQNHIVLRIK